MISKLIGSAGFLSSGGTIGGDLTISGDLTVSGGGGFAYTEVLTGDMVIQDTADNATGGVLRLQNTRAGGAGSDNDDAGTISFYASDAGSNSEEMSTVLSEVALNTTGSTAGKLTFKTMANNSSTALLSLNGWSGGSDASTVSSAVFSTSQVKFPDGTVSLPALAFSDDPNTGWYAGADGVWSFSDNGTKIFDIGGGESTSGGITASVSTGAGILNETASAINPTILPRRNDLNTGIGGASGDTIAFITNAVSRMLIDDNSRISLSNNDDGTSNTIFGKLAGAGLASTGNYNVFIGEDAGNDVTIADNNVAIGYQCFDKVTTAADDNVAIGYQAMHGLVTTTDADDCVAIGSLAMSGNLESAAGGSVAVGKSALAALTTGGGNTAVGYRAGVAMTTSSSNVVVGYDAFLVANGGQNNNVIIGYGAASAMDTSACDSNVIIGKSAGVGGTQTTTKCIVIGESAMTTAAGGSDSQTGTIAIGHQALTALTSGAGNVAVGYNAGLETTVGDSNIAIGYQAMLGDGGFANNNNIAIGSSNADDSKLAAMGGQWVSNPSSHNIAIGVGTMAGAMNDAESNIAIGRLSLAAVVSAKGNIAIGGSSGTAITEGIRNVIIGHSAGLVMATQDECILIGYEAGKAINNDTADGAVAVGYQALTALTIGAGNTAMGSGAGTALTIGRYNTSIGYEALFTDDVGDRSTALGYKALYSQNSDSDNEQTQNTGIGMQTGFWNVTGKFNTYVGNSAGNGVSGKSHSGCVFIGANAGYAAYTGDNNIAIGYGAMQDVDADDTVGASTENIFIGKDAGGGIWATAASNYNVGIGNLVMDAVMNGALKNTAVGHEAGTAITTGSQNTLLGFQTGIVIAGGRWNTCLGDRAGDTISSGDANTAIGTTADCAATVGNQIAIGNGAITDGVNKGRWGNSSVSTNNIQTDWTVDSDIRIKKDIESSDIGLSFINALKTRKYKKRHPSEYDAEILESRYKSGGANYDDDKDSIIKDEFDDNKVWNGLVAQEVKTVMDDLDVEFSGWSEDSKGKQGVQYSTLVVPLIKAVQELTAKVEALEAK